MVLINDFFYVFFYIYIHVFCVSHGNKFLLLLSQQKLRSKNQEIKGLIDKLRTLIWNVNTMMALKPS